MGVGDAIDSGEQRALQAPSAVKRDDFFASVRLVMQRGGIMNAKEIDSEVTELRGRLVELGRYL